MFLLSPLHLYEFSINKTFSPLGSCHLESWELEKMPKWWDFRTLINANFIFQVYFLRNFLLENLNRHHSELQVLKSILKLHDTDEQNQIHCFLLPLWRLKSWKERTLKWVSWRIWNFSYLNILMEEDLMFTILTSQSSLFSHLDCT